MQSCGEALAGGGETGDECAFHGYCEQQGPCCHRFVQCYNILSVETWCDPDCGDCDQGSCGGEYAGYCGGLYEPCCYDTLCESGLRCDNGTCHTDDEWPR